MSQSPAMISILNKNILRKFSIRPVVKQLFFEIPTSVYEKARIRFAVGYKEIQATVMGKY